MATTINDYTLEIGWSGKKVNDGINKLENRLKNLNKKVSDPLAPKTTPRETRQKKRQDLDLLNDRKLALISRTSIQLAKLKATAAGINLKMRGGAAAHAQIQKQISSVEQFRANLRKATITSQQQLRIQGRVWDILGGRIKKATAAVRGYGLATSNATKLTQRLLQTFKQGRIAALVAGVTMLTREVFRNGKAWEKLRVELQASFGSAKAGEEEMSFLKKTARELGLDIMALAGGYAKIGATAKMTGMASEKIRGIFLGVSEAATAFGLSVQDTDGVMRAFSQMLGKQQVMAEELKLQLGDRFPIAIGVMAKSIGKTVPELIELMEAGELGTDAIVKFAAGLRKNVRESGALAAALNTTQAVQNRFNMTLREAGDALFQGGLAKGLKQIFNMGTDFFEETKDFWGLMGLGMGTFIKFGVALIKVVLLPIQKLLGTIGDGWKLLSDLAITDRDEIDKLNTLEWIINRIYLHFVDIWIVSRWLGKQWDELFGNPDKFFKDIQDELLLMKDTIKYLLGLQDSKLLNTLFPDQDPENVKSIEQKVIEGTAKQNELEAARKAAKGSGSGDKTTMSVENLNMTLPIGTTSNEAPQFAYAFAENQLNSQLS
ncbi:MAG: tape measure protein [Alphaproteobacteria bacterium]|nr:tape measure protein [Alphaproteobacteria bacterium]